MKIISWNVNSVRARLENIINYIEDSKPDIMLLQEIKTQEINFPKEQFKEIGYDSHVYGQKSYNGVAFLSKIPLSNININFIDDKLKQSRIITCDFNLKQKKIQLINIYVPNGNPIDTEKYDYKKNWLNLFVNSVKKTLKQNKNIIISGDYNIIGLGDDYEYAVVGSKNRSFLWFLSRTPELDEPTVAYLKTIAISQGYNTDKLIKTPKY